jgi:hypothetical protein
MTAIFFTTVGSLTGVSTGTTYWVNNIAGAPSSPTSCKIYATVLNAISSSSPVAIGGTPGGASFSVYLVGEIGGGSFAAPFDFVTDRVSGKSFMQDGKGQVWTNYFLTSSNGINDSCWVYLGVTGTADTGNGFGIAAYTDGGSIPTTYIFSFNQNSIDYFVVGTFTWTWGWNPFNNPNSPHQTNYLKSGTRHRAITTANNILLFCDGSWIGGFYETNAAILLFQLQLQLLLLFKSIY